VPGCYLLATAVGNLLWKTARLRAPAPYDLEHRVPGRSSQIAAAVLHCTRGDVVVALCAVVVELVAFGRMNGPPPGTSQR
jgi:hypothetical protein